ncbi:putative pentatricopeptide repeat-containing protein [Acorus calamus]|uniref:Pentatricopeptide repeat-containing protein n=1 Tax=Acorus calamus TaxID=4465 RepID=A0AAV9EZW8_ACOCL|nr:putative pentatricopeptide repeat-containing protein [Acorus calamus]
MRRKTPKTFSQSHAAAIKLGLDRADSTLLFHLLRSCPDPAHLSSIFARIENPGPYHFTALIDNLASLGANPAAMFAFARMISASIEPDPIVVSSVLKASDLGFTRQVHAHSLKLQLSSARLVRMRLLASYANCVALFDARRVFDGLPNRDPVASTIMVSCYASHGLVEDALAVFDRVIDKDTVCWTAMIDGLVKNGQMNEALEVFRRMQGEGVRPNEVTVVCVLSACAHLGALELGRWVHSYSWKYLIELNAFVGPALIDMYSKCGSIEEAETVFDTLPHKDVASWNSMINGYAMHGLCERALEVFSRMVEEGVRPNSITFACMLNACSHAGKVDAGFKIFNSMEEEHGIEPRIEHHGCMVDLLGRVGHLEEAYGFVRRMRVEPDHVVWGALLSACKSHGNLELGREVAGMLVESGKADSGTYVLLSSIYASSGEWGAAARARADMKGNRIVKEPGCSSIEIDGEIHEFMMGDIRHPRREEVYKKLEELNEVLKAEEGYVAKVELVAQDIEEGAKERALGMHREEILD